MHRIVPNRHLTMVLLSHVSMTCPFLNLRQVFNTISIKSRKIIIRNKWKEGRMLEWQGKERKESPMPVSKEKVNGVCPYLTLKAPSSRMMVYKKESIDISAEVPLPLCSMQTLSSLGPVYLNWWRRSSLLSLHIQMLVSSRNIYIYIHKRHFLSYL